MTVQDLWRRKDGTPTARDGRGLRYRVRVDGYPTTAHRTRAEAEHVNAQRILAGPPTQQSTATVADLVRLWLDGKAHLSPKGRESAANAARHVTTKWGTHQAADLDTAEVQAWLSSLTTKKGPASQALRLKVAQCITAATAGHTTLGKLSAGREHAREPHYLTPAQLALLADKAGPYRPMIMLLGTTGLRLGECCALTVGDVDPTRRRIRVRTSKNGEARDVPVTQAVLGMLNLDRPAAAPLFTSPRGEKVDGHNWRPRVFYPAAQAAKLAGVHPHDLRHTAASMAIASGADVKTVQRMLGHKTATLTLDRYGHLWDGHLDDVAQRIDAMLAGTDRVQPATCPAASPLVAAVPGTGQVLPATPLDSSHVQALIRRANLIRQAQTQDD